MFVVDAPPTVHEKHVVLLVTLRKAHQSTRGLAGLLGHKRTGVAGEHLWITIGGRPERWLSPGGKPTPTIACRHNFLCHRQSGNDRAPTVG